MGALLLAQSPDEAVALSFPNQQEWLRPLSLPRGLVCGLWFKLKLWFRLRGAWLPGVFCCCFLHGGQSVL